MSTPLDRLKEAFPESKGWQVMLEHRDVFGWCAVAIIGDDRDGASDTTLCHIVRWRGTPDAAVDACIAKAREVGINSDAEAHADRLAEALRRAKQLLSRANAELEKHKSGREMWHEIADYFDPAELGGFGHVLAAHDARRGKA